MTRNRILFVDDEPRILDGLVRMLRPQRDRIDVLTATGGEAALALLAREHVDAVISDMRMPLMDGAALLAEVRGRHPHCARIILSGQSDRDTIVRATRTAHQFLSKPCNPDEVRAVIDHVCSFRSRLADDRAIGLVSALDSLPSSPGRIELLAAEIESGGSPDSIATLIASDVGLSAKVIQVTSTSFFGNPRRSLTPSGAARWLGSDSLKAMLAHGSLPGPSRFEAGWAAWDRHSRRVAGLARSIADAFDPDLADAAEIAGMLHDCGRWALTETGLDPLALADDPHPACAACTTPDAVHGSIGGYLLSLWGLSEPVAIAVAAHHHPSACPDRHRLTGILHLAEILSHEFDAFQPPDLAYLDAVGLGALARDRLAQSKEGAG